MGGFILAKTLLIIGGGAEQIPAFERARARGLTTVFTDINEQAPARPYADYFIKASTRDISSTLEKVDEFNRSVQKIDGVMTIANDVPLTVAVIANQLKLPGISIESAKFASDKLQMKQQFLKHNVRCPWFQEILNVDQLKQTLESRNKIVIKPIDGRGARGVLLLDKNSDLEWAFAESKRWGDCGRVMVEEFIQGQQLSTESFFIKGKCFTAAIADRNYSRIEEFKPYIIEDGGTIPANLSEQLKLEIDALLTNAASAIGIYDGIIKGDLVIDQDGKPQVIEIAARLSGGWFASHQIPKATGIDLVNSMISFSLSEEVKPVDLLPTQDLSTTVRYWFPEEGKILSIQGEESLKKRIDIISYGFFRSVGDYQPKVKMHPDRFGYVIVFSKNREESLKNAQEALLTIKITTEK